MNKVKTLIVALGLMSFSVIGQAGLISPGDFGDVGTTDSLGTINLQGGAPLTNFGDNFVSSLDVFYDIVLDVSSFVSIGVSSSIQGIPFSDPKNVSIGLFSSNGDMLFDLMDGPSIANDATNPALIDANIADSALILNIFLDATSNYFLRIFGSDPTSTFDVAIVAVLPPSEVPVPAAGILFASALFGAGFLGRRKKKAKTAVMGAFARAA